jgi:ribosomal protein L11 methylase PrmA
MHDYTPTALAHKQQLVSAFIERIQPRNVWDLGANVGLFSRLASRRDIPTLAFDLDPGAVEQNYLACVAEKEKSLLPLVLNLVNPSPSIGWHNQERMSFLERGPVDAVMALALVHHLAIANNVPLGRVAEFFSAAGRWLIIESVPKEDAQVQKLLAFRDDIFADYTRAGFEQAFGEYFVIRVVEPIRDSMRSLYLMERI